MFIHILVIHALYMKETKMILKMDQEKYQLKIQALIEKEKRDVNVKL